MMYVIIALVAAFFAAFGMVLQKKALDRVKAVSVRSLLASRLWLGGLVSGGVSFLVYLVALGMGPISIVQPLMSASILFVVVLGYFFLRESLSRLEGVGIAMIVVGIALISGVVI